MYNRKRNVCLSGSGSDASQVFRETNFEVEVRAIRHHSPAGKVGNRCLRGRGSNASPVGKLIPQWKWEQCVNGNEKDELEETKGCVSRKKTIRSNPAELAEAIHNWKRK